MFERFSDRARRVVVLAQEEAKELDHGYIGTEHILLGLIGEEEGRASVVIREAGIDLDGARSEVLRIVGRGDGPAAEHIPFTPRAKKVLELALREALVLGHNYIGTGHILLGLIRDGEGVAVEVLAESGLGLPLFRERMIDVLRTTPAEAGEPSAPHPQAPPFAGPGLIQRLERLQRGLDRIERRLDAMGAPADPSPPREESD
ncbi:Clp protease [Spongiactinospora rosea]|uniref:Clp protease n=1 Tax=Spongiactinospora rosea TaxID=2248750 RepID=A0A366LZ38_9ACTN|nr:Clp protease N-terminal domain-containing protein [Spongiactinospora rosea]RBQ19027.1 Clp protease [Spongiactinospora rosea]